MVSCCQFGKLKAMTSRGEIPLLITKGGVLGGFGYLVFGNRSTRKSVVSGPERVPPTVKRKAHRGRRSPHRRRQRSVERGLQPRPVTPVKAPLPKVARRIRRLYKDLEFLRVRRDHYWAKLNKLHSEIPRPDAASPGFVWRRYRKSLKGMNVVRDKKYAFESAYNCLYETQKEEILHRARMDDTKRITCAEGSEERGPIYWTQIRPPKGIDVVRREFADGSVTTSVVIFKRIYRCEPCGLTIETSKVKTECPKCSGTMGCLTRDSIANRVSQGAGNDSGLSPLSHRGSSRKAVR